MPGYDWAWRQSKTLPSDWERPYVQTMTDTSIVSCGPRLRASVAGRAGLKAAHAALVKLDVLRENAFRGEAVPNGVAAGRAQPCAQTVVRQQAQDGARDALRIGGIDQQAVV